MRYPEPLRVLLLAGPVNGPAVLTKILSAQQAGSLAVAGVITDERLLDRPARVLVDRKQRGRVRAAAEAAQVPVVNTSALKNRAWVRGALAEQWRPNAAIVLDTYSKELPLAIRVLATLGVGEVHTTFFAPGEATQRVHFTEWNYPPRARASKWLAAALTRGAAAEEVSMPGLELGTQAIHVQEQRLEGCVAWIDAGFQPDEQTLARLQRIRHPRLIPLLPSTTPLPAADWWQAFLRHQKNQTAGTAQGAQPPRLNPAVGPVGDQARRIERLGIGVQEALAALTAEVVLRGLMRLARRPRSQVFDRFQSCEGLPKAEDCS